MAAEDSAAVAAGAGAATTEQEGVAEGDKPQGEEKEADVSQVTHVGAWESVLGESGQIQQLEKGKAAAALCPQGQTVATLRLSWDSPGATHTFLSESLIWVAPAFVPLCSPGLVEMGLDGLMAPVMDLGVAQQGIIQALCPAIVPLSNCGCAEELLSHNPTQFL